MKQTKSYSKKLAAAMMAALIGTSALPFAAMNAQAAPQATAANIAAAVKELNRLGVMSGYEDNSLRENNPITRAELAKLLVIALKLEGQSKQTAALTDVDSSSWYGKYVSEVVGLDIMPAAGGTFRPQESVTDAELVQAVAKALKRDVNSVIYWMNSLYAADSKATRGEAAYVLDTARQAVPSAQAKVTSVKSLNAITLIVTFNAPLTSADEAFDKAKADFTFNDGLTLTNMPRLKTGSVATYIVPTSVQKEGVTYNMAYKGKASGTFTGSGTKLSMTKATQVTSDTFEVESLKAEGVVDYGYIISAYSAGRGANAFVTDDDNRDGSTAYQVISSMQARQVTITPAGGQPIVAKYVPFTQSTDGKQEPKFRLPEGQKLTPGVAYTVTSDWAVIANPTFTAGEVAPLNLSAADAAGETSLNVTLTADPGDELFSGRSVQLTAANGDKLVASYRYSSRKGAVGVFDIQQNGKLTAGAVYTVTPVGDWAAAAPVTLTVK